MTTRKALGRGLDALIPPKREEAKEAGDFEKIENVPVDQIVASRYQPRIVFNEEAIKELANSIKEKGVIQPIIVAKKHNGYELVAGERRWRAVRSLGQKTIPAIIKVVRDSDALELALIENIQRENLNPIEEANAFLRLMKQRAFTQEELAKNVGKSRPAVANALRLLKLPDKIKDDLADGLLTIGHAKAILALDTDPERLKLRDQIINSAMSVRETEQNARSVTKKKPQPVDIFLEKVRIDLERKLASKVAIKPRAGKRGVINIHYTSVDDLNRIIELIG
ncbi:Chromosome (plasmid) partitioning protein ParB [hydrothermal vent metagenome]|uniref:Chromosome (Plasmid) partitioning protein ParB n=1 Tax=hydrothermal vent metagenome TaxID=652676 RepID=A0A3B1C4A2_9ZZZZ